MAFNYSPKIVRDSSLVLCLDAANPNSFVSGSTVWRDISKGGNNGTLIGGVTYNSSNNGSLVFNGSTGYVLIPSGLTFTTFMTVDIWFRSTKATRHHIVNFGIQSGANSLNFDINDGRALWIYWNDSGTNSLRFTSPTLSDGVIRNLTFVHNNNVNTVYINGSVLTGGSVVGTQTFTSISGNIYLGSSDAAVYTQGNIYNFKVYNRALSATEVLQNYNALKGRYGLR